MAGELTKLRLKQGCALARLVSSKWKDTYNSSLKKIWKHNLACMITLRAKQLGITLELYSGIWHQYGGSLTIREVLEDQTFTKACKSIVRYNIFFLDQLLNRKKELMITWSAFRLSRMMSDKERRPGWFEKIECKVLVNRSSKSVLDEFKSKSENKLAIRFIADKPTSNNHKQEWLLVNHENKDTIVAKTRQKKRATVVADHWLVKEPQSHENLVLRRCASCDLNKNNCRQEGCEMLINNKNILETVPKIMHKNGEMMPILFKEIIYTRFGENSNTLVNEEQDLVGLKPHSKKIARINCKSLKKSKRIAFRLKYIANELPVLSVLTKRRPEVYKTSIYILCGVEDEMIEHLSKCIFFETLWLSIESITVEIAWSSLSEESRFLVTYSNIRKIILGINYDYRQKVRSGSAKGLLPLTVDERLQTFLLKKNERNQDCLTVGKEFKVYQEGKNGVQRKEVQNSLIISNSNAIKLTEAKEKVKKIREHYKVAMENMVLN
ncbi:37331_t:CDS:2, partial [Gigaspora margarita]